jgi:hypothetical protein
VILEGKERDRFAFIDVPLASSELSADRAAVIISEPVPLSSQKFSTANERTIAALSNAPSTSLSPAVQQGNLFNRLRQPKYEFREVYVNGPGGRRYILDAYSPTSGEIVSLKATQFGDVSVKTGVQYVQEAATKYAPGARIANVPTSGGLAGQELRGTLYLEVPIQAKPIPQKVLDAAASNRVIIRDVTGKEY